MSSDGGGSKPLGFKAKQKFITCHTQNWVGQVAVAAVALHGGHCSHTDVPGAQADAVSPPMKLPAALPGCASAIGPPQQVGVAPHLLTGSFPKSKNCQV